MKNGKITIDDIAHHIPENWSGINLTGWLIKATREELIENLKIRINAINHIDPQAPLKPKALNRRSKEFQKCYAALSKLTFDQLQQFKKALRQGLTKSKTSPEDMEAFVTAGLVTESTLNKGIFRFTRYNDGVQELMLQALSNSTLYKDLL